MNNKRYITLHTQKDGRLTIGTALHLFKDCSTLKSRTGITEVDRANILIKTLPKCFKCYNRKDSQQCPSMEVPKQQK